MTQRVKHKISLDYKCAKKRNEYRQVDTPQRNDGWVFSDRLEDWFFSKYRRHENFPCKF